ncbi:MAG: hypothetical protein JO072_14910, partial [Parafilimonas sp.]|nr:hypothetical protein [Parafilimonas sp.]
ISKYNIEQLNDKTVGLNVLPSFKNADDTTFMNVTNITDFDSYKIIGSSPVMQAGIDLQNLFNINIGDKDFNGRPVNKKYLGACTNQ